MDKKEFDRLPESENLKGWRNDWRIMGQEGYLMNEPLQYRRFDRSICVEDFLQCEFCWAAFDEDPENPLKAYFAFHQKCWICEQCFQDFQKYFHWTVENRDE